ncbi:MAG TPA: cell division protein ZipA C-terminal FtsZ-binding domain-containing protein [Solimonas sp.]
MSPLQWALLVIGAAAVIAIYWISRRDARSLKKWEPPSASGPQAGAPGLKLPPGKDQMDMFSRGDSEFDEFGVGKPRKRMAPSIGEGESQPLFPESARPRSEPAATPKPVFEEKIVTLLIAEREGTAIFGAKIHAALQAQGLQYGDRKIYHRLDGGKPVFSVASLVKPGTLDPADAGFSTPGLSLFMVLPGPAKPQLALQDMIATARALAAQLNAEVFDASRLSFNADAQRVLVAEIETWARRNGL